MHIGEINNNCQVFTHILEGTFLPQRCKTSRAGQLDICTVLVSGSGVSGPRGAGGALSFSLTRWTHCCTRP